MKILDRYISTSVAGAFCFGVLMFMVLLMAMSLLDKLIELITEQGIPVGTALAIFAYQIPGMLAYAFPMSMLLGILLTFSRMSADSEMVAIRAGGVSFVRITVPTLLLALIVAGLTFWIADSFGPYAGRRATELTREALQEVRRAEPMSFLHKKDGKILYSIEASDLDVAAQRMSQVLLTFREDGEPLMVIYADEAHWQPEEELWEFKNATVRPLKPGSPNLYLVPGGPASTATLDIFTTRVKESPFDLDATVKDPREFTSTQIRERIAHMEEIDMDALEIGKWRMGLAQRYAIPFASLVFALIGAPLGLRHHRTSSAVGLGISVLIIFAYYFFIIYLKSMGESGVMPVWLAAWLPNILGAGLGAALIVRANR